ncbi:Gfo/Idh/MocA family oxidoreductase, partial [bacterium]|nr:Gfo/Idh/MocA family oxidoreductase [bacterium]
MIKVGVIGVGEMGQHHARLYSQLDCELVDVVDIDPRRAKEIGEKYHTAYYTDYHELISKVDAVSIAVPTSLHCQITIDCVKQGVHCLVEKPIAASLNEAEEMVQRAEENRTRL